MSLTLCSQNLAAEAKPWQRKTFVRRLDHIADGLEYYRPGVFLAQETGGPSYLRRLDDTFLHIAPGYRLRRVPHGGRWRHIWIDEDQVKLHASGLISMNALHTKHAAWAKVTDRESGKTILPVSVHLSEGNESRAQTRYKEADRLLRRLVKLNPNRHPEIVGGDFNSFTFVGRTVFEPSQYDDALDLAKTRTGSRFNTFNGRTTVTPHASTQRSRHEHLDHFYVKCVGVRHWSQRPNINASDHNIIAIKVQL